MFKHTLSRVGLFIFVALTTATAAFAFDFTQIEKQVTVDTLKNGLTIIVMERHDAPVVSFVTYVNAGDVDDPKGYGGLAHMFEHLAFKGTTTLGTKDYKKEEKLIAREDSLFMLLRHERTLGRLADTVKEARLEQAYDSAREASYQMVIPNEFGNIIERQGGQGLNAGTGFDETVYSYSLPANKVELWMATESERFLNPVFREMYKERDVIAEERRMRVESNPIGRLIEDFLAMSFKAHPYGMPGIGAMSDIQYYSRQEAKAFFNKYYVPSNMVICIVGDVKAPEVMQMAAKYWERIPAKPKPDRIATVEPPQLGERTEVIEDPSQPFVITGWHVPEGTHPDRPAIDALTQYLASGRTSALYKEMVKDKKIAIQVGAFAGFPGDKYPTMAAAYAVPSQGHTASECEADILAAVEKIKNESIPQEELDKIKARAKASFISRLDNNDGLAYQLAGYQTQWGDWRQMFKELDRINAVTVQDVQRVAKLYFTTQNRDVAIMNTIKS